MKINPAHDAQAPEFGAVVARFLAIVVASWMLLAIVAVPFFLHAQQQLAAMQEERARSRLEMARQLLQKEVFEIVGDLRTMAQFPAIQRLLGDGGSQSLAPIVEQFGHLARYYGRYEALCIFDANDAEVLHLSVAQGDAAEASRRRAFALPARPPSGGHTRPRRPGEIHVSAVHERDALGTGPVVRFEIPVSDARGRRVGTMDLHYRMRDMLRAFRLVMRGLRELRGAMLSQDGRWLADPEIPAHPHAGHAKDPRDFAGNHPGLWRQIVGKEGGRFDLAGGTIWFEKFHPLRPPGDGALVDAGIQVHPASAHDADFHWVLVVWVPRPGWTLVEVLRNPPMAAVTLLALALLPMGWLLSDYSLRSRRSHAAEQRALAEISDLYENAPCGYLSLDPHGTVLRANRTALAWLGQGDALPLEGGGMDAWVSEDDRAHVRALLAQLASSDSAQELVVDLVRRDGTRLPVSLHASTVRRADGGLAAVRLSVVDITARRRLERELERRAHTDVLTGMHNRRFFLEQAPIELRRALRSGEPLSLMLMDVDHFKSVNDRHGHDAGDRVLVALARTLREWLRSFDLQARLGGEEFVVLMPDTDAGQALWVAQRVRLALADAPVLLADGSLLGYTVSIGVVAVDGACDSIEALLRAADEAMYRAKAGGRNRVELAPPRGGITTPGALPLSLSAGTHDAA